VVWIRKVGRFVLCFLIGGGCSRGSFLGGEFDYGIFFEIELIFIDKLLLFNIIFAHTVINVHFIWMRTIALEGNNNIEVKSKIIC